ncbi:hypothetical protein [Streptomyces sp. NPDC049040]|uniref:hypothetical protein n=1 Tax=Streptomyces sp. NPDC049040 TaxID=3365593 RepID=UPI00372077D1
MRLRTSLMVVSLASAGIATLAACSSGSSANGGDQTIPTAQVPTSAATAPTSAASGSGPGAGNRPTTSAPSTPRTFKDQSEATGTKYARCMRSNGIDIPDPATPEFTVDYPPTAKGKAAFHTCSPFLPEKFHSRLPTPRELEQDFAFARCMRESELTDYPDPDGKYGGEVIAMDSQWFHDPRLEDINKKCHAKYPQAGKASGPRDFGPMG